jgi:hypothetical protein
LNKGHLLLLLNHESIYPIDNSIGFISCGQNSGKTADQDLNENNMFSDPVEDETAVLKVLKK